MARVRIRHYVVRRGRGFWQPTAKMKAAGFAARAVGTDGPAAWAEAERLNAAWDAHRTGAPLPPSWPPGSLGDVFERYRKMAVWSAKKPRTREEWEDVFDRALAPVFGDMPVAEIDAELVDKFYRRLGEVASTHRRHRIFKVFRAMLNAAIAMKLIATNPTEIVRNTAPAGRDQIWLPHEVPLLVATARHMGYRGLAVAIAVAYDSQLQPVDVRSLTLAQRRRDGAGCYFDTARAKTSKRAFATLSAATEALLDAYVLELGATLVPSAPILRNRSGQPYTKDTLADDFRKVRNALYVADDRRMQDLRRTGNVEAAIGGARPQDLSAKAGNTIGQSNRLFETYTPVQLAAVRNADAAREKGRRKLSRDGS